MTLWQVVCKCVHSQNTIISESEAECRVDAQQLDSAYQGSWRLDGRRAYPLYMEVRISTSTRWPLDCQLTLTDRSHAGDLGSYLLWYVGAGPGGRNWWSLVLSCRMSRPIETLIWHQITFRGQPLWGSVPGCWYSTAVIAYLLLRRQTSSGL